MSEFEKSDGWWRKNDKLFLRACAREVRSSHKVLKDKEWQMRGFLFVCSTRRICRVNMKAEINAFDWHLSLLGSVLLLGFSQ